jgi:AcrR family transcriptional regulator
MAKSGVSSRVGDAGDETARSSRRALVEAAIETLRVDGFARASARTISARAGCNQGLVFYYFGSVSNLLLAALDSVSADRLARYGPAVDGARSPEALVDVAATIFREDLDAGYAKVLVEMIAAASSTPGLDAEVLARIAPWTDFAHRAVDGAIGGTVLSTVIPSDEIAYAVVALYLGLEMLSQLAGDRASSLAVFARATDLVKLVGALAGTTTDRTPRA